MHMLKITFIVRN